MCQCREYNFGERDRCKDRHSEKELFPVECHDEHAECVGEESQRSEPKDRIDGKHGVPEVSRHAEIIPDFCVGGGTRTHDLALMKRSL